MEAGAGVSGTPAPAGSKPFCRGAPASLAPGSANAAIALARHLAPAYYNRGIAYYSQGKLDHAITDFHKAIAFDPNYTPAYNNRGRAYEKMGDKEQAIADYRKSLEIDPSNQKAKEGLMRLGVAP